LPAELRGFNWGAFFLSWVWGIRHRVYIALLALIPLPLIGLIVSVHVGNRGNELAWQRRRWESVDAFRKTQRRWGIAGGVVVAIVTGVYVTGSIVIASQTPRDYVEPAGEPITYTADDGSVELTVPSTWSEDPSLHRDAVLQASSRVDELYAAVFVSDRVMFAPDATRKQLAKLGRDELVASLDGGQVRGVTTRKIGGMGATVSEVAGAIDGLDIVYLSVLIETPTRFIEVSAWTLESGFAAKRSTMYDVIDSVREIAPATTRGVVPA
jgi:hypothetical protein